MEVGRHTRSLNFQLSKELSTLFFLIKDYPYLQAFHFLETTPLLCILDDFLEELDAIFLKHETRSTDPPQDEGRGKMSEGVRDVDGEYMELLEMYCLLRVRLLDVRHNWGNVTKVALRDHGKYAGMCVEAVLIIVLLCNIMAC